MITCAHLLGTSRSRFFQMRLGAPHKSGENREAGENPARSRHCEDRRSEVTMQSQETCPDVLAAFERPRKGVQAAVGIFLSGRDPVASLSPLRRRKAAGFCFYRLVTNADRSEAA